MEVISIKALDLQNMFVENGYRLLNRSSDTFVVDTFCFLPDGDAVKVVLQKDKNGKYQLTDEGHTLIFLSFYLTPEEEESISDLINDILSSCSIQNCEGRLKITDIPEEQLISSTGLFTKGVLKIVDTVFLQKQLSPSEAGV